MDETTPERCKGCGKIIEPTTRHMIVEQVEKKQGRKTQKVEEWGRMHPHCFARLAGKPRDLLDVLSEREATLMANIE
jgi:hypothetical protein